MSKKYVVRTENAGVFFGEIKERTGDEIVMTNVRKIYYWSGATETLGLAKYGVKHPENCKFTAVVDEMTILGVIEVIPCTDKASKSLSEVQEWKV